MLETVFGLCFLGFGFVLFVSFILGLIVTLISDDAEPGVETFFIVVVFGSLIVLMLLGIYLLGWI